MTAFNVKQSFSNRNSQAYHVHVALAKTSDSNDQLEPLANTVPTTTEYNSVFTVDTVKFLVLPNHVEI